VDFTTSSFDSSSTSTSSNKYAYRTPGLSISRSFEKEIHQLNSKETALLDINLLARSAQRSRSFPNHRNLYQNEGGATSDDSTHASTHSQKSLEDILGNINRGRDQNEHDVDVDVNAIIASNYVTAELQTHTKNEIDEQEQTSKIDKSKEIAPQLPERQQSAMQAFLISPTGLNWDDLVRSMREEMFIKTITIQKQESDDSSSIGSLTGSSSLHSIDSSISSKSLKHSKKKCGSNGRRSSRKGRDLKKNGKRGAKKGTLEQKVEKVLRDGSKFRVNGGKDEPYPFINPNTSKRPSLGGQFSAFSVVKKQPITESNTSVPKSRDELTISESPVIAPDQNGAVTPNTSPFPGGLSPSSLLYTSDSVGVSPLDLETPGSASAGNDSLDSPELISPSGESEDDDSFYYHIRGEGMCTDEPKYDNVSILDHTSTVTATAATTLPRNPSVYESGAVFAEKLKTSSGPSKAKTRVHHVRNPYAFSNHPLLPIVLEEKQPDRYGHISPFPTSWGDDDDSIDAEEGHGSDKNTIEGYTTSCGHHEGAHLIPDDKKCLPRSEVLKSHDSCPVVILAESLAINKKTPTRWQRFRHNCHRTKGSF